jgi:Bacterial regulatory helix-turn-helix protein, lysR family
MFYEWTQKLPTLRQMQPIRRKISNIRKSADYCLKWNDLIEKAMIGVLFLAYFDRVQAEIELCQMRYFLAIAEERSFSRASKRCHVAQSSLSR